MEWKAEVETGRNTRPYDKPNEDYALADDRNGIFIIADGVSRDKINGVYPKPSPSAEASRLFVGHAHESLLKKEASPGAWPERIREAFREGNGIIREYNDKGYEGSFRPGTVGIIAVIREEKLYYGYIGDCIGMLISREGKKQFTECQTRLVHEHIKEFTADQVRNDICNHKEHPCSYGVLDGREGAMDFVVTGACELSEHEKLILATDGAEAVLDGLDCGELLRLSASDMINGKNPGQNEDDRTILTVKWR